MQTKALRQLATGLSSLAVLLSTAPSSAQLRGQLVYRRQDALYRQTLPGSDAKRIDSTRSLSAFALSPAAGALLLFSAPDASPAPSEHHVPPLLLLPPAYTKPQALPPALQQAALTRALWSGNGKTLFLASKQGGWQLTPGSAQLRKMPIAAQTASQDGSVVVGSNVEGNAIIAYWPETGKRRVLFTAAHPQPLFQALREAKYPAKVKDLQDTDSELSKDLNQWQVGAPALMPDGKRVFFAANMGGGMGAAGNTTFCFFVANTDTGKLAVLSKAGSFFGRIPDECQVSPDGLRLGFFVSIHDSAIDNRRLFTVIDLLPQTTQELMYSDGNHKDETNLTEGFCWSPDSRYVALSALYYRVEDVMKHDTWEPKPDDFDLWIKDVMTRKTVRRIKSASAPQWTR